MSESEKVGFRPTEEQEVKVVVEGKKVYLQCPCGYKEFQGYLLIGKGRKTHFKNFWYCPKCETEWRAK